MPNGAAKKTKTNAVSITKKKKKDKLRLLWPGVIIDCCIGHFFIKLNDAFSMVLWPARLEFLISVPFCRVFGCCPVRITFSLWTLTSFSSDHLNPAFRNVSLGVACSVAYFSPLKLQFALFLHLSVISTAATISFLLS